MTIDPTSLTHDSLAKRVIERIEDEHITPKPHWQFVASNAGVWAFAALLVVLGAFAAAALLFEVATFDWQFTNIARTHWFTDTIEALPLVWLLLFALFGVLGYYSMRKTNHGYRYSFALLALSLTVVSLVLGGAFFVFGMGEMVENNVGGYVHPWNPERNALYIRTHIRRGFMPLQGAPVE